MKSLLSCRSIPSICMVLLFAAPAGASSSGYKGIYIGEAESDLPKTLVKNLITYCGMHEGEYFEAGVLDGKVDGIKVIYKGSTLAGISRTKKESLALAIREHSFSIGDSVRMALARDKHDQVWGVVDLTNAIGYYVGGVPEASSDVSYVAYMLPDAPVLAPYDDDILSKESVDSLADLDLAAAEAKADKQLSSPMTQPSSRASQPSSPDFRGTRWGMTSERVLAIEKAAPIASHEYGSRGTLDYTDVVAGIGCKVIYIFAAGKLVRAKYVDAMSHTNKNDYLSDFETMRAAVSKKYGAPQETNETWKNDLYRDQPQEWGLAVSIGHLAKWAKWETPRTFINMLLEGDNYDVTLTLEYQSKEFASLEESASDRDQAEKF